jgi:parallel beta-helix repeat protein
VIARLHHRRSLVCFSFLLTLALAPSASATPTRAGNVIDVYPGKHALKIALASANPGDTLLIHTGKYNGRIMITTPSLLIEAAGDGPVSINARCNAENAVTIQADGTTIDGGAPGGITITGGRTADVWVQAVSDEAIDFVTVTNTCHGVGGTEYGFHVTGTRSLVLQHSIASGWFDNGGIYVSSILLGALITIADDQVYGANNGIELTGIAAGTVSVMNNHVDNSFFSGIRLVASKGVTVTGNVATNNEHGIDLLDDATHNLITYNLATGNYTDLVNRGGKSNCFRHNTYDTHLGRIACRKPPP